MPEQSWSVFCSSYHLPELLQEWGYKIGSAPYFQVELNQIHEVAYKSARFAIWGVTSVRPPF